VSVVYYPLDKTVIDLDAFESVLISGLRGSGKSALLEVLAEQHHLKGRIVLDLFAPRNFEESFYVLPGAYGVCFPIVMVHPPQVELHFTDPRFARLIKPMVSTTPLQEILETAERLEAIVTVPSKLWPPGRVLTLLTQWLWALLDVADRVKTPLCVCFREASVAFSQYKVFPDQETDFKRALIWYHRHARHHRTTVLTDIQRSVDMVKTMRSIMDRYHIKRSPKGLVPDEYKWALTEIREIREKFPPRLWKDREMNFPKIPKLYPREFYAFQSDDQLRCVERNSLPIHRHKSPYDNFLRLTGLVVKQIGEWEETDGKKGKSLERPIWKMKMKHPEWSNRAIAKELECSHSTVNDHLRFLQE